MTSSSRPACSPISTILHRYFGKTCASSREDQRQPVCSMCSRTVLSICCPSSWGASSSIMESPSVEEIPERRMSAIWLQKVESSLLDKAFMRLLSNGYTVRYNCFRHQYILISFCCSYCWRQRWDPYASSSCRQIQ